MAKKSFSVKIDDRKLNRQISSALKASPVEALKAMNDCVLDLAGESARRAPIETGDLRSNCHGVVQGQTVFENKRSVPAYTSPSIKLVGSVGYSLPYALRQHEDLTLDHSRSDGTRHMGIRYSPDGTPYIGERSSNRVAGGESKYLEKPFMERKGRYIQRFEQVVEKSIK